jgi:hypothetical protein
MANITRSRFVRVSCLIAGAFAFAQVAAAQTTTDKNDRHMPGGGTQPGPGTHGHSSSPKTGETKDLQERQHDMPATPSHSGNPQAEVNKSVNKQ